MDKSSFHHSLIFVQRKFRTFVRNYQAMKIRKARRQRQLRRKMRDHRAHMPVGRSVSLRLTNVDDVHNTEQIKILIGLHRINEDRTNNPEPYSQKRASIC